MDMSSTFLKKYAFPLHFPVSFFLTSFLYVEYTTINYSKQEVYEMGKYEVKQTKSGFRFNLKASNGQVIGTSETYSAEKTCLNGVESVKKNAPIAAVEDQTVENFVQEKNPKFEMYTDKAGEFRFRLKAKNGEIILVSEGYKAKASCVNGIESVKKNAESEVEK